MLVLSSFSVEMSTTALVWAFWQPSSLWVGLWILINSEYKDFRVHSLIPRPRPQGGKGSGIHQALFGACRIQYVMWLAWQCIVLAWQHINHFHVQQLLRSVTWLSHVNHMVWSDWRNRIRNKPQKVLKPFLSSRAGSGNETTVCSNVHCILCKILVWAIRVHFGLYLHDSTRTRDFKFAGAVVQRL